MDLKMIKSFVKFILSKYGYKIVSNQNEFPIPEASQEEIKIIYGALKYSMTNEIRAWTLINSIKYIHTMDILKCFIHKCQEKDIYFC